MTLTKIFAMLVQVRVLGRAMTSEDSVKTSDILLKIKSKVK